MGVVLQVASWHSSVRWLRIRSTCWWLAATWTCCGSPARCAVLWL